MSTTLARWQRWTVFYKCVWIKSKINAWTRIRSIHSSRRPWSNKPSLREVNFFVIRGFLILTPSFGQRWRTWLTIETSRFQRLVTKSMKKWLKMMIMDRSMVKKAKSLSMLNFPGSKSTQTMFHTKDKRGMIIACPKYREKLTNQVPLIKKKKNSLLSREILKCQSHQKIIDDLHS